MKKRYARYCSVACSSSDPARISRIRESALRAAAPHPQRRSFTPPATEEVLHDARGEELPHGFRRLHDPS